MSKNTRITENAIKTSITRLERVRAPIYDPSFRSARGRRQQVAFRALPPAQHFALFLWECAWLALVAGVASWLVTH